MALFSTLQDDFQTGTISTSLWPSQNGASVQGGQAKLTGTGRTYIQSAPTYAIASSAVYLRITANANEWADGSYLQFGVYKDDNNWYGIRIYGPGNPDYGPGTGEIWSVTAGVATTSFCYYSTATPWNQLRHDGTRFWHDSSSNLTSSYSQFAQPANPGWNPTTSMYMRIETQGIGAAAVWVDNININASLGMNSSVLPGGVIGVGVLHAPDVSMQGEIIPTGIKEWAFGNVDGVFDSYPSTSQPNNIAPAGITDTDTPGPPTLAATWATPTSAGDTEKPGAPAVVGTRPTGYGDGLYGQNTYGGNANDTAPIGVGDPENVGDIQGGISGGGTPIGAGYGTGLYNAGIYNGSSPTSTTPAGIVESEQVGDQPLTGYGSGPYGAGTYNAADNAIHPAGITDQQAFLGETLTGYGSGTYGTGPYQGTPATPSAPVIIPPTPPVIRTIPNPLHILGIGPWNPVKAWNGAANYGIGKGLTPARPVLQLPGIQSKSVTLRLDGGNEATVTCQYARNTSVVIHEMATDLWWLRKDPRTGLLENLGRFNCSHNDLTRDDDGTVGSALQFQDWRIVIGNRMVLKYLKPDLSPPESQWAKGTPVTEILRFAIPTDTGVNLSALDDDTAAGKTTQPFTLPPYNTINDTITALLAISETPWEWWVETPTDFTQPPTLKVALQRGTDKGVTLFDYGTGPSPIASWQMRRTSDNYANRIYFQGGGAENTTSGGVIREIAAAVTEFGGRDTQISDNSITGALAVYEAAADKALAPLADTRPTFTLTLRTGFWRGRNHIDVGDTLRLRIRLGKEHITYTYRVTELQIDVDGAGTETVTVTLGTPLASANPRSQYSPVFRLVRALKNYSPPPGSTS